MRGRYDWRYGELYVGRTKLVLVAGNLRVQPRLSITPDMSGPGALTQVKRCESGGEMFLVLRNPKNERS